MGLETATLLTIGSSVVSGIGAISQGNAAAASAGYNAQVAANNAKIATQNAQFAAAEGEQNTAAMSAKTRAIVGATLANQGASGIDINSDSSINVRESEAKLGMLDALNVRSEAARKAYGFQTESAAFKGQQGLYKSEQGFDRTAGYLDAFSSVLGGVGKSSQYNNWLDQTSPLPWQRPGNVNPEGGYY